MGVSRQQEKQREAGRKAVELLKRAIVTLDEAGAGNYRIMSGFRTARAECCMMLEAFDRVIRKMEDWTSHRDENRRDLGMERQEAEPEPERDKTEEQPE